MLPSPPKLQPALLGGLFSGVLSALPIVSAGNVCCCLWVVCGGLLAAYLMQQNYTDPVALADGAVAGFLAGVVGAVVYVLVAVPITVLIAPFQREIMERFLQGADDLPPDVRQTIERMSIGVLGVVLGFLLMLFAGMIFGTLGGLLGALMFRRSAPRQPAGPPPPLVP